MTRPVATSERSPSSRRCARWRHVVGAAATRRQNAPRPRRRRRRAPVRARQCATGGHSRAWSPPTRLRRTRARAHREDREHCGLTTANRCRSRGCRVRGSRRVRHHPPRRGVPVADPCSRSGRFGRFARPTPSSCSRSTASLRSPVARRMRSTASRPRQWCASTRRRPVRRCSVWTAEAARRTILFGRGPLAVPARARRRGSAAPVVPVRLQPAALVAYPRST